MLAFTNAAAMEQVVSPAATLSIAEAQSIRWDLVVIGAGVAGAVAAREVARAGKRVLLVDKRHFPRRKVCGACLNDAALGVFGKLGLMEAVDALGGRRLDSFAFSYGSRSVRLNLPGGRAVSRECLDAELIRQAIIAGVEFLPGTIAKVADCHADAREIELTSGNHQTRLDARAIVVASGLEGLGLADSAEWTTRIVPSSRLGAGCVVDDLSDSYSPGTIWMSAGKGGYVGLVRVEGNRLNIAAAFDRDFLRECGSPGTAAGRLLETTCFPVPSQLSTADWLGTVPLTRATNPVASRRVFLVGDAAGYVEPFTGEGMTWALLTGYHVARWVRETLSTTEWSAEIAQGWISEHRQLIRNRQRLCRVSTWVLRSKILVTIGLAALGSWPWLARHLVERINAPGNQGRLARECRS